MNDQEIINLQNKLAQKLEEIKEFDLIPVAIVGVTTNGHVINVIGADPCPACNAQILEQVSNIMKMANLPHRVQNHTQNPSLN